MIDIHGNPLEAGDHVRVVAEDPVGANNTPALCAKKGDIYQVDRLDTDVGVRLTTRDYVVPKQLERVEQGADGNWIGVGDVVEVCGDKRTVVGFKRDYWGDSKWSGFCFDDDTWDCFDTVRLVDDEETNDDARIAREAITVYVAGPYSEGDLDKNIRAVIFAAEILVERGRLQGHHVAPLIPHLNKLWDDEVPHDYEFWLELDFAHLSNCDACFRVGGHSPGADRERAVCKELGIPYFTCFKEYEEWIETTSNANESTC